MAVSTDSERSSRILHLPEAGGLVLKEFRDATMSAAEVRGSARNGVTTCIPPEAAYLVQLRLLACNRVDYFSDGRHVDGVDMSAGVIQFHDLRRNPVAVIRAPFHVMHVRMPVAALRSVADEMHAPPIDELQLTSGQGLHDPTLQGLLQALRPVLEAPGEASTLMINHIAQALAGHVAQRYGGAIDRSAVPRGGLAAWQKRMASDLLEASIADDISLSRLAAECGLSVRHFSRAFQQSFGVPPHRYLLKRRIERAKEMMERSSLTLLDIALACGFVDQSHFTRVFRAAFGVTPGVWRHVRSRY